MSGCVYLITNRENGKKYVGQHHKADPKRRWAAHKRAAGKYPFHNALKKYGAEGFTWEVLIVCAHEKLTAMEGFYAEIFESYIWDNPGGYNAAWCSENSRLGLKASPETKEKIRQAQIGKKKSPEHIERMRGNTNSLGSKNHLGKKHSPEAIEKLRQAWVIRKLGKKTPPETIEKIRKALLGKKKSPEACEKMRQAWVIRKLKSSILLE